MAFPGEDTERERPGPVEGSLHVQWGHASGWGSWSGVQLQAQLHASGAPLEVAALHWLTLVPQGVWDQHG